MLKTWRTPITSMSSRVQHRTNLRLFHVILAPDNLKCKNGDMDTRMDFTTGSEDFEFELPTITDGLVLVDMSLSVCLWHYSQIINSCESEFKSTFSCVCDLTRTIC